MGTPSPRAAPPGRLTADRAEPRPNPSADLARRPRTADGHTAECRQPAGDALIREGAIFEGATGEAERGRKPTSLYIDSRNRCVLAVDIRPTRTFVMVTDLVGRQLASVTSFPTEPAPKLFIAGLAKWARAILAEHKDLGRCEAVGVGVGGMVDSEAGRVLLVPNLVALPQLARPHCGRPGGRSRSRLGEACALAELWRRAVPAAHSFVYITVSDGLGVGVVLGGELVRGQHISRGNSDTSPWTSMAPACGCGAPGCWEA